MAKEGILLGNGKLTMKRCEKVPAERKEQPGEEEGGDKRADTPYVYGKLTMKSCEKVPAERKEQPGEEEGGGEGQEGPGPRQVYHRREEVLQIPRPSKCQKSWIIVARDRPLPLWRT